MLLKINYINWEGYAFVGVTASLVSMFLVIRFFILLKQNGWKYNFLLTGNKELDLLFFASLIILLYSFGFPFMIGAFKPLIEYLGPLRQIRSIGRFAWVFCIGPSCLFGLPCLLWSPSIYSTTFLANIFFSTTQTTTTAVFKNALNN